MSTCWLSRDPIQEGGGLNLYGFVKNDGVNQWDVLGLVDGVPAEAIVNIYASIQWWDDDGGVTGGGGIGINDDWLASTRADIDAWCKCGAIQHGSPNNDGGENRFWWGGAKYIMNVSPIKISEKSIHVHYFSALTTEGDSWVSTAAGIAGGIIVGTIASIYATPVAGRGVAVAIALALREVFNMLGDGHGWWATSATATCPEWHEGDPVYQKPSVTWGGIEPFGIANRESNPVGVGFEHYVPLSRTWRGTN